MAPIETIINTGDSVIIERDLKLYPSKGSWSQFESRLGTVCTINRGDAEYGVGFQSPRIDDLGYIHAGPVTWFRLHELEVVTEGTETAAAVPPVDL